MAIAPTPNNNLFKGLVFDGIDSRDYGIYITGSAVYNSPERDVEEIEIPGRNGSYMLDNGRFKNITVTYPAGIFGATEADFAAGISAFRNALASRKGYKRLEDDYNADEYRMAVYRSGLEVSPTNLKAGEFEIVFDCQPQRFLKSGEEEISVSDGDTITNPTLFASSPLLAMEGYGVINIGGQSIGIDNDALGEVLLANSQDVRTTPVIQLADAHMNNGDQIRALAGGVYTVDTGHITNVDCSTGTITGTASVNSRNTTATVTLDGFTFTYGTDSTETLIVNTTAGGLLCTDTVTFTYDASENTITFAVSRSAASGMSVRTGSCTSPTIYGDSTWTPATGTVYIDTDVGAVYTYNGSAISSLNNIAILPATLPTLEPGANVITYDNTITSLTVTPRWWEV